MSRNLLHKSKLSAFCEWLTGKSIKHRPGRGEFQVMQIQLQNNLWACIYDRLVAPEHYTCDRRLETLVRKFIKESKK